MTKFSRAGKLKPVRGPRTIIIDLENDIDKDMLVYSAHTLKTYEEIFKPIFISRERSSEDIKKQNEAVKLWRDMIKKSVSTEIVRVRNQKLQKLFGGVRTKVLTVKESNSLHLDTATLYSSLNILQFNVRDLLAHGYLLFTKPRFNWWL